MSKNRKITRREAHVRDVYATEINPEAYLRMERALKWRPVKTALEAVGVVLCVGMFALAGWALMAMH